MRARSGEILGKLVIVLLFLLAVLIVVAIVFVKTLTKEKPTPAEPRAATPVAASTSAPPVGVAIARIKQRGELLVGMDTGEPPWTGTPPMFFPNEKGDPDGFDYQVAVRIANDLGVKVKLVHGKYADLPGMLTGGQAIDLVISGYAASPEPGIAWSHDYLEYGLCLVVPSQSKVKSVADLFGKPVGIFDDDAAAEEVQRLVKGYTEMVRLQDGYWDQLLQGRFAGFIYDYPYAVAEINNFYKMNPHRKGALRIAQYNLSESSYVVGVREADADLLAAVNATLDAFRESPAYTATVKAYLSGGIAVDAPLAAGTKTYTVKAGDTLSLIAGREMGSPTKWEELWKLNKARFPNPHLIEVGDKVVLP